MLAGLLVRLLGADPDEFLEDVAHLDVVDVAREERSIRIAEGLDDLVEQVLLRHARDLLIEREALHDLADVLREPVDVGVEVRRELVRVVEQLRQVQLREVVERAGR